MVSQSNITRSFSRNSGCLSQISGEIHLVNVTVEDSTALSSIGVILIIQGNEFSIRPVFMATFTSFHQHDCTGSLFSLRGSAQALLQSVTFAGCDLSASNAAFANFTSMGCGETFTTWDGQRRSVCGSQAPGACSSDRVANTTLDSLTCECP
eukprot:7274436-Prymnesium_polylepis.1